MPCRDIIVIGGSAGGIAALVQIVARLPVAFPVSVFVVCHISATIPSLLPEILSRSGPLLAKHPLDGETFYPGHIYVAPPDHHLLLGPEALIRLTRDARENRQRPAIDPLFRSAARYYGRRAIAVILTGGLYDGTAGLLAVRANGGLAVIQDPSDAFLAEMPQSAARIAGADHTVSLAGMAPLLVRLVNSRDEPSIGEEEVDPIEKMPEVVDDDMNEQAHDERRGKVSVFTCPECGGALWQVDEAQPLRFRCHVGHAYNGEVLLAEQTEALEAAMWTAVRTFREKSVLASQLANRERRAGQTETADRFEEQAQQADRYGALIRSVLLNHSSLGVGPELLPGQRGPQSSTGGGHERGTG